MGQSEVGLLEGDYIETIDGLLFAVKGIHHPPGLTIAYLRYIPDSLGGRKKGRRRYRRHYDLEETEELLRRDYTQYLNKIEEKSLILQSVPDDFVARKYRSRERLNEILTTPMETLEETISKFARSLENRGASIDALGVSGSVLVGLAGQGSDVDMISIGMDEGLKVYRILKELREEGELVRPYNDKSVLGVVRSRWGDTGLNLGLLASIEMRKALHGLVEKRDYFMRLVRLPQEFEDEVSLPLGVVSIRAVIKDTSGSIFTPCSYRIDRCRFLTGYSGPEPSELLSYRGKFTEQAEKGDTVEARGTLEEVIRDDKIVHRIVLGAKGDYLIPLKASEG